MRLVLCKSLLAHATERDFVFLTGDLGFQVFEPLREAVGVRFINAGLMEQNMISVAAGLAWTGLKPWVYSIAPFVYARPYEQIRNDVCMHDMPVTLVGNGGGYGYGVMGSTHHALGDYGALLCLDHMRAFVPAFAADVSPLIDYLSTFRHPAYLRLGRCELPSGCEAPSYAPWRRVLAGRGPTMLVVGPLAGGIWGALAELPEPERPEIWVLTELPLFPDTIPGEFLEHLRQSRCLAIVEEHVAQGGVGQMLCHALALLGQTPPRVVHRCALGYPSGLYGSQTFHRRECGLDPQSILRILSEQTR